MTAVSVVNFPKSPVRELNDALHEALIDVACERNDLRVGLRIVSRECDDLRVTLKIAIAELRDLARRLVQPIPEASNG